MNFTLLRWLQARILMICFFPAFLLQGHIYSQVFTDSNLPVIVIKTSSNIKDDFRVSGTMKVIYKGPGKRNALTDQADPEALVYDGNIDIEFRGSSSQSTPKKSYGFSTLQSDKVTGNNVSLLGMPPEHDWVLNGMVFDAACMRDYICYNLSRKLGEYASRTEYCEVVINGEYKGLYLLQEKIKADDNRVDINKIQPEDNQHPKITGGYIVKADKTTGGDPVAWTMYTWQSNPVNYILHFPKPDVVTRDQQEYIKQVFMDLAAKSKDPSITEGYPSIIDIPSFINFMMIQELSSNADGYHLSTFFHKDRNGKLRAGPIWDNDLTFGYDLTFWGLDRSKHNVWQLSAYENDGSAFWRDLFLQPDFRCYVSRRWHSLTAPGQPLNQQVLISFIDKTMAYIREAHDRNRVKWNTGTSIDLAVSPIKSFIYARIAWINENIGPYDNCAVVDVPQLVISKIMYQPLGTDNTDEQEFVEITNAGEDTADVTGVYFRGTGFVYQFPAGTVIPPGESVTIAADTAIFEWRYGYKAFDEYNRHLANDGQCLLLADAFGNTIDSVHYSNLSPWPSANANGSCLALKDISMDNSLAENWTAVEVAVSAEKNGYDDWVRIYPNPFTDVVYLSSGVSAGSIEISDISGRIVFGQPGFSGNQISVAHLKPGVYIFNITVDKRSVSRKMIKVK